MGGKEILIDQSNGVRQGSPDSPVLFAARVGELLVRALQQTQQLPRHSNQPFLPPPPYHGGSFMDDTYNWGEHPAHIQATIKRSSTYYDFMVCESIRRRLTLFAAALPTTRPSQLGGNHTTRHGALCHPSPGHAGGLLQKNPHLVAEMQSRARGAFASNSRLLTARTPLRPRMLLHQALVRQSTLWACETRPVQDTLLRSTTPQNAGGGRRPGEDWVDWNKRSVRCLPAQNRGGTLVYLQPEANLAAVGARHPNGRCHQRHALVEGPELLAHRATQRSPLWCQACIALQPSTRHRTPDFSRGRAQLGRGGG